MVNLIYDLDNVLKQIILSMRFFFVNIFVLYSMWVVVHFINDNSVEAVPST